MNVNRKLKKYNVEETEEDKLRERKNEIRKKVGKPYLKISPKTENQEKFVKDILDKESMYVIATGIAGAGKTFIALVQAINLLLNENNTYTKIRIFKPLKQLQHEDVGILPGGVEEKLEYVLMSYSMQLNKLLSPIALEILFKEKIIEVRSQKALRDQMFLLVEARFVNVLVSY